MAERISANPPKDGLDRSSISQPTQELLNKEAKARDDDDDEEETEEAAPEYSREAIGPRIGETVGEVNPTMAAEALGDKLDSEDKVPVIFPNAVHLQDQGIMHHFAQGVHLVPISLAGKNRKEMHWWLRHNKCRHAGSVIKSEQPQQQAEAE